MHLLGVDVAGMSRYEPDDEQTIVAAWPPDRAHLGSARALPVSDDRRGPRAARPARPRASTTGAALRARSPTPSRRLDVRCVGRGPIVVAGRLWGVMIVDSRSATLPDGDRAAARALHRARRDRGRQREARAEVQRLADEQAALRRVATLVARESVAGGPVRRRGRRRSGASLQRRRRRAMLPLRARRHGDRLAAWGVPSCSDRLAAASSTGDNVAVRVLRTGQPARMDSYEDAPGPVAEQLRAARRALVGRRADHRRGPAVGRRDRRRPRGEPFAAARQRSADRRSSPSWWRPRSPTPTSRAELAAPRPRRGRGRRGAPARSSATCTTARSSSCLAGAAAADRASLLAPATRTPSRRLGEMRSSLRRASTTSCRRSRAAAPRGPLHGGAANRRWARSPGGPRCRSSST